MSKFKISMRSMLASALFMGTFFAAGSSLHAVTYDLFVHGLSTQDHCSWSKNSAGNWVNPDSAAKTDVNNYWAGTAKPGGTTIYVGFNKNATNGALSWQYPCGAQFVLYNALNRFCRDGNNCRIYTHSTGGLVAAGLMAYLQDANLGAQHNILQIRLMANASGGAELATRAPQVKAAVDAFLITHPAARAVMDKYVLPWCTNSEVMKSVRVDPARQAFDHNKTTGRILQITMGHNMTGYHRLTQPFLSGLECISARASTFTSRPTTTR